MDPAMAAVTASRTSRAAALAAPSSNNDAPSGAAAAVGSAAAAVGGEVSASSAATGTSAPPLGGCQVFVNIVEGRSLSPRDRNGSADPLVKVVFDGQQQHTDTIDENLCPVWDETLVFDTDIQSAYQLDASSITFECWDADTVSDELIGAFELDLGQVWQSTDHELYRRWVALTDITGKHEGVQGYLRVSVAIVPEGCNRVTQHDEHVDFDDLVDVLVSPSIEMVGAELVISCFSAERLPPMDSLSGSCDPYFMVDFAGKADTKTKHVSNTLDPVFNEQLIVPVFLPRHGPPTSNRIRCCVWDYPAVGRTRRAVHKSHVPQPIRVPTALHGRWRRYRNSEWRFLRRHQQHAQFGGGRLQQRRGEHRESHERRHNTRIRLARPRAAHCHSTRERGRAPPCLQRRPSSRRAGAKPTPCLNRAVHAASVDSNLQRAAGRSVGAESERSRVVWPLRRLHAGAEERARGGPVVRAA
jgi:hypothetical protein